MDEPFSRKLGAVEEGLEKLTAGGDLASAAARHLVMAGGKRIRPTVCMLAARSLDPEAPNDWTRSVAIAAEAVHGSTLLHDDVIDEAGMRRGRVAARLVFGNAASILGGDLLMIQALGLVEETGLPGLVGSLVEVMVRMISAEALQLEQRGQTNVCREDYFSVVEGKTASLFEWAARAGALTAVGRWAEQVERLGEYGHELGVAFQVRDDLLDLTGDPDVFGKSVVSCLREGVVTYPLLVALESDPDLGRLLEKSLQGSGPPGGELALRVREVAEASGGLDLAVKEIRERTERALDALRGLPESEARGALESVALALAKRVS